MKTVRVAILGRVQGVGFRMWLATEAEFAGIAGWVRNRRDGSVEALLSGGDAAVDRLLAGIAAGGPPGGVVLEVQTAPAAPPAARGFSILPTE